MLKRPKPEQKSKGLTDQGGTPLSLSEGIRRDAIKGIKYFLSAWKARYEKNIDTRKPLVDDYRNMEKSLEWLEK